MKKIKEIVLILDDRNSIYKVGENDVISINFFDSKNSIIISYRNGIDRLFHNVPYMATLSN